MINNVNFKLNHNNEMHAHVNKSMLWLPQYNLISFLANLSLFKLVYSVQVEMGFEPRTVSLQDMKIITGATVFLVL